MSHSRRAATMPVIAALAMVAAVTVAAPSTALAGRSGTIAGAVPRASTLATVARPAAVPKALRGKNLERIPTRAKVIALTFDGGGDAAGVPRILRTLRAEEVPATFFFTGRWARTFPRYARTIAAQYPVANHSETHPDMTHLSSSANARQVTRAATSIRQVIGRAPIALFRFPYGAYDRSTISTVNALGYSCIGWSVDTIGWMGTSGGMSRAKVLARVMNGASRGGIVLMHLGSNPTDRTALDAEALPQMISGLRAKGYRFVTLPAALGLPAR